MANRLFHIVLRARGACLWVRGRKGLFSALALALLLAGCAPGGGNRFGAHGNMSSESAARMADSAEIVYVVPPEGVPIQTALVLADAIAAEIRDADHPAILARAPNQAGASIVGQVSSAVPRDRVTWMILDWSVRAPYGTLVSTYRQQVVVDTLLWQAGAPEAINLVVTDAAQHIVNLVHAFVGPPSATAMHYPAEAPEPSPAAELAPDAPAQPQRTTMDVRMASQAPEVAAAPAPVAPAPESAPSQALARIADGTNGQVVHAQTAPRPLTSAPVLTPPGSMRDAEEATGQAAGRMELPSLLTNVDVATAAPAAPQPAAAPPRALTPGTQIVSPPPGAQIASPPPGAEPEDGVLTNLLPNMDSDVRRPGDARPAGPGGAAFAPVRWGSPSFLIKPVTGAPGNGNEALTAALKSALRDRDLTISEDPRQAGFLISGAVNAGTPVNGRQYIRISWIVNTVTGEEVGKAVQENTVVAGSLDGEWGRVAEAVAYAAVRGIQDLFGDADSNVREREVLPEFPKIDLPTIPGRAPPPPSSL